MPKIDKVRSNFQKPQVQQMQQQPQTQTAETSIFEKHGKSKGHGLGNGGIPPGIQKKLDSGSLKPHLSEKFVHLKESVDNKAQEVKTDNPIEGIAATIPQKVETPVQKEVIDNNTAAKDVNVEDYKAQGFSGLLQFIIDKLKATGQTGENKPTEPAELKKPESLIQVA